jgi:hypothetical protein
LNYLTWAKHAAAPMSLKGEVKIDMTAPIRSAMADAIDMAKNAHEAMDRFSADSKVQEICKIALGDDQIKLARAKGK